MWNDSYRDYVKAVVETSHDEYPYYMAHTCTYFGTGSTVGQPAFKIYLSKEPITANGLYTYLLPADTLVYSVIGVNAGVNNNSPRVRVTSTTVDGTVGVNEYEFVYSNAEYSGNSVQPDLLAASAATQNHFDAFSLILLVILLGALVVKLFKRS